MPDEWCELLSVISLTNTLMSANALTWWKNGDKSELQCVTFCFILHRKPYVPYVYFCQSHIAAQCVYDIWEIVPQSGIG